ncbi:MAG: hypothetical protein PHO93_00400 [Candidatus Saccharimonadaceae bacterium]|nr:hypothetical protein [Candidatus Saccharimonadaceae bacterium]
MDSLDDQISNVPKNNVNEDNKVVIKSSVKSIHLTEVPQMPKKHLDPIIVVGLVILLLIGISFAVFLFSKSGLTHNNATDVKEENNISGEINPIGDKVTSTQLIAGEELTIDNSVILKRITVGSSYACAISADNQTYCWGYNAWGQLGNGTKTVAKTAVKVDTSGALGGKTIKSISAGLDHTCAIASDDQLYCWGDNGSGQLGNGSYESSTVPVAVNTAGALYDKTILSVAVGWANTCVLASDNGVYCWGYNVDGRLGNKTKSNSNLPIAVDVTGVLKDKKIVAISDVCAIDSAGQAYCWGGNWEGQLGNGTKVDSAVPVAVDMTSQLSGKKFVSIDSGSGINCAVASDEVAYCWGSNDSLTPKTINNSGALRSRGVKSVATGISTSCVIASDDQVYCWGSNIRGGLGNNSKTDSVDPVAVDTSGVMNNKKIVSIASSGYTCALSDENEVFCWGDNNNLGQLGNSAATNGLTPTIVQDIGK